MTSTQKSRPDAPLASSDPQLHRRQIAQRANASILENGGRLVSLDPIHATDSGTDTYVSETETDTPLEGYVILRDFQSSNTTNTPTLDGTTITAREGFDLWAGAISGTHFLEYDGTNYVLLDPSYNPVSETAVDATNGGADDLTEIDFTGIRNNVQKIIVLLDSVSLSGSDDILVQIGDSGGFETTGYDSASTTATGADSTSTSGYILRMSSASVVMSARFVLELFSASSNKWFAQHMAHNENSTDTFDGLGIKSLSGVLDRIRITTTGTNTFDAGSVNIVIEG